MTSFNSPVVGVLGSNGNLQRTCPEVSAMALAGNNTGNLIYQYAANKYLNGARFNFNPGSALDLEKLRRTIDILHIPAANQLNPAFDLEHWARIIEYLDKPVFIAGLGYQGELNETHVKLSTGTVRFIRALQRLAPFIGTRGLATKNLLEQYGVDNAIVTGCPSNFINKAVTGQTLQSKIEYAKSALALKVDYFPGTLSNHRPIEKILRSMVHDHEKRYVLQTNEKLFDFVDGNSSPEIENYLAWERQTVAPHLSQEEFNAIYSKLSCYYFSAPAWIDSAAKRDLGIGMRMHGVVATIQGGTAGVCVVSDGRIEELVDTMGYPHVKPADVESERTLVGLLERVNFDPISFDAKRENLKSAYLKIASATGISVTL